MANTHLVELSDKELYILWTIACFFKEPVTSALKYKLSKFATDPMRKKFEEKFDAVLMDRVIEYGKWLEEYRRKEAEKNA